MSQDSNKRKYLRTDRPFALKMRFKPDEDQKATSDGWKIVFAKDLSAGGVFLQDGKGFEVGSLVDFKIYISRSLSPLGCVGKVNRIEKQPESPLNAVAISFTEIDEQERDLINEAVEESLR